MACWEDEEMVMKSYKVSFLSTVIAWCFLSPTCVKCLEEDIYMICVHMIDVYYWLIRILDWIHRIHGVETVFAVHWMDLDL